VSKLTNEEVALVAVLGFLAILFLVSMNIAIYCLAGVCLSWMWNTWAVPNYDKMPEIVWWQGAAILFGVRFILGLIMPRKN